MPRVRDKEQDLAGLVQQFREDRELIEKSRPPEPPPPDEGSGFWDFITQIFQPAIDVVEPFVDPIVDAYPAFKENLEYQVGQLLEPAAPILEGMQGISERYATGLTAPWTDPNFQWPWEEGATTGPQRLWETLMPPEEQLEAYRQADLPSAKLGTIPEWLPLIGGEDISVGVKGAAELAPWLLSDPWAMGAIASGGKFAGQQIGKGAGAFTRRAGEFGGPVTGFGEKQAVRAAAEVPDELLAANARIGQIKNKWATAKTRNSVTAKRDLDELRAKGVETDDAANALDEYTTLERRDFDDAVDFSDARAEAWDQFVDELDRIEDIVPIKPPALPEAARPPIEPPPVEPPTAPQRRGAKRAITIQETKALAEIGQQTPEALTEKLVQTIEAAVPVRVQTQILKSEELKRRVAAGAGILERGTGKKAFEKAKAPLAGDLPKAEFTPPELSFTPPEIDGLFDLINKADLRFFSKLNTAEALTKVLTGQIPTKGEIWLLERIFGKDFGKALRAKGGRAGRWFEMALDVANIPRSFLTAFDLSAPLRQGALLLGQPREWAGALKPMVRAFGSEKYARLVDDIITDGPNFIRREASGLYHAPLSGPGARLSQREEAFISRIASRVPGIRASERAYITYLNKLRADSFDSIVAGWERAGVNFGDDDLRALGKFVNYATGRGGLWKLEEAGPILSTLLFSPRLQMSRFQAPAMLLSSSPLVRRVAMRNFAAFYGSMTTIVSLAALMEAKVELDPRSSNFGKIQIGNTRIDPWAGYQQYARYAAQMITGWRKTTSTETLQDVERKDVRDRFLRSKASPAVGLLWDIVEGETFLGEELYEGPASIAKAAKDRLTPMFASDMWDALEQEGLIGGLLALPGGLGMGVTSFEASQGAMDAMTLSQSNIGTVEEDGNVYSLGDFGSEANRVTKNYESLEQFSPLVQFYRDSKALWDAYYENTSPEPMSERIEYRERNPEVDSRLFLFGKVSVLRSTQAQSLVSRYLSEYKIPGNAVGEIRIQGGQTSSSRRQAPALPLPWR